MNGCDIHIDDLPPLLLLRSKNDTGYRYVTKRRHLYRAQVHVAGERRLCFLGGFKYLPVAAYAVSVFFQSPSPSITSRKMIGYLRALSLFHTHRSFVTLQGGKKSAQHTLHAHFPPSHVAERGYDEDAVVVEATVLDDADEEGEDEEEEEKDEEEEEKDEEEEEKDKEEGEGCTLSPCTQKKVRRPLSAYADDCHTCRSLFLNVQELD